MHILEIEPDMHIALRSVHGGYIHVTSSGKLVRRLGSITRSAIFKVETYPSKDKWSFFSLQNRCCITADEEGDVICLKKYRDTWDQWSISIALKKSGKVEEGGTHHSILKFVSSQTISF